MTNTTREYKQKDGLVLSSIALENLQTVLITYYFN